jgi:hypothetical protein
MRGSADMARMRGVGSPRIFFRFETACQDKPLEMELESTPAFFRSEMRAARDPF